mmetsp:Transcript_10434/g.20881  ORF Transcript_10434/g.20881 Transcript_10434/m.20881 type:complete len:83 (+) Transcript_10434:493-741(+)
MAQDDDADPRDHPECKLAGLCFRHDDDADAKKSMSRFDCFARTIRAPTTKSDLLCLLLFQGMTACGMFSKHTKRTTGTQTEE